MPCNARRGEGLNIHDVVIKLARLTGVVFLGGGGGGAGLAVQTWDCRRLLRRAGAAATGALSSGAGAANGAPSVIGVLCGPETGAAAAPPCPEPPEPLEPLPLPLPLLPLPLLPLLPPPLLPPPLPLLEVGAGQ